MKKAITFMMLVFITASAYSQVQSENCNRIYKTSKDFKEGKFIPAEKIRLHHTLSKNYIEVIYKGQKTRYCKDSIFGYSDADKKEFRFFKNNDDEYQILENKGIVLYVIYTPAQTSKGKSLTMIPTYYFSRDINSPISSLTIQNLKLAYAENSQFISMLDTNFDSNTSLVMYDNNSNMYRLNYLIIKSIGQSK